ncbi:MAG: CDP-alcohol phosphatidyltransferase family protein [Elusimicrobiota bacterium]
MTSDAVLWVSHPALMFQRLAGLSVLERQLFLLSRAGFSRVWITARAPEPSRLARLRLPQGLTLRWAGSEQGEAAPPYVGVSADHLVRLDALKAVSSEAFDKPVSFDDAEGKAVLSVLPTREDAFRARERRPMSASAFVALNAPWEGAVLPWLFQDAVKSNDSFMARHFDRRVSLALTRRLLDTRLSPNAMTVSSTLVGLAGAALMLAGTPGMLAAGALTVWVHTLLDGCDGELARLRFQESRLGGVLDFWGDNAVHGALFLCLGIGLYRGGRGAAMPALGVLALAAAAASAWLVYSRAAAKPRHAESPFFNGLEVAGAESLSTPQRLLSRLEDALARRDFVYILVAAALAGRLDLFLWAAGIGAPLFLAALVYLIRKGRDP